MVWVTIWLFVTGSPDSVLMVRHPMHMDNSVNISGRLTFRLHNHQLRSLSRVMETLGVTSMQAAVHATRVNDAVVHYVDLAHMDRISRENPQVVMSPLGNSATVEIATGEFTIRSFSYHPSSAAVIFMFTGQTD